ncbi:unnamed protein product [Leptidea sinapis]|uniref:Uncharacterized protein n=1 Tax=Leptidea sinapis TaxID=189913 RepID=A0A5E4Q160_9NEOP|nr:unnamed protein product [Leptidea sinapis]
MLRGSDAPVADAYTTRARGNLVCSSSAVSPVLVALPDPTGHRFLALWHSSNTICASSGYESIEVLATPLQQLLETSAILGIGGRLTNQRRAIYTPHQQSSCEFFGMCTHLTQRVHVDAVGADIPQVTLGIVLEVVGDRHPDGATSVSHNHIGKEFKHYEHKTIRQSLKPARVPSGSVCSCACAVYTTASSCSADKAPERIVSSGSASLYVTSTGSTDDSDAVSTTGSGHTPGIPLPLPIPILIGLVNELADILIGFTFDDCPNANPDGAAERNFYKLMKRHSSKIVPASGFVVGLIMTGAGAGIFTLSPSLAAAANVLPPPGNETSCVSIRAIVMTTSHPYWIFC